VIETTHDEGNKILIIKGLTDCNKLINIGFSTPKVFDAGFRSLLESLNLALQLRNVGSRLGGKPVG
jgi:hypothetical protein